MRVRRTAAEQRVRPVRPSRPADPRGLLALQATIGNWAVLRLLTGRSRPGPAGRTIPVQRARINLPDADAVETGGMTARQLAALRERYASDPAVAQAIDQALHSGDYGHDEPVTVPTVEPGTELSTGVPADAPTGPVPGRQPEAAHDVKRRRTEDEAVVVESPAPLIPEQVPRTGPGRSTTEPETPIAPRPAGPYAGRIYLVGEQHDPAATEKERAACQQLGWGYTTEASGVVIADPELAAQLASGDPERKRKTAEGDPTVPVESVLLRRLDEALRVAGVLRHDVWGKSRFRAERPAYPNSTRDSLQAVAATMRQLLELKTFDYTPLGNLVMFNQRLTDAASGAAWKEALEDYGRAGEVIKWCQQSAAFLQELVHREFRAVGLADHPAVLKSLAELEQERSAPTFDTAVATAGRARSLLMYGLITRYAAKPPDNQPQLVKVGVAHIRDIEAAGLIFPPNVLIRPDWTAFTKAVPEFS